MIVPPPELFADAIAVINDELEHATLMETDAAPADTKANSDAAVTKAAISTARKKLPFPTESPPHLSKLPCPAADANDHRLGAQRMPKFDSWRGHLTTSAPS